MNDFNSEFYNNIKSGFIEKSIDSSGEFIPRLLTNDRREGVKVLSSIISELNTCEEFWFSVAFLTNGGLQSLLNTFKELQNQQIKGKILVSQYLNFTQPEALKRLLNFNNIELRINTNDNFHSKGYLFKKGEFYNLIIGSSNLTATALSTNKELNLKVSAKIDSYIVQKALLEFNNDFNSSTIVDEAFIEQYKAEYEYSKNLQSDYIFKQIEITPAGKKNISPNVMQVEALVNLKKLRSEGKNKALLISATGTGKTYLSAFDAKEFNPKSLLFVVHRENIAKASQRTFEQVFGFEKKMGFYSGARKEAEKDFIFSTIQTISKGDHMLKFAPDHFDYIIVDESHRAGADTYKKILNYFKPKFLLGMTATPERTDGDDIFSIYDHNIAYEIRLQKALETEMLSPFHYFGVTDISINGQEVEEEYNFNSLTADERVNRIIEKSQFYNCDDGNIRGLIFCSRNEDAFELSKKFNTRGFKTVALSSESSSEQRTNAIDALESNEITEKLDYIFTVDIFNEGIDIPRVNQVIMLRPTKSAIIFVQQLGRGLRKAEGKDYLTVIDFIGNYSNNFLIPIALFGDTSYNKDNLRKLIAGGSNQIPGTSTINFDSISKEKIYAAIDKKDFSNKKELKKDYDLLKFKIGRIPMMMDFMEHGARDPFLYVNSFKSYYNFVAANEKNHSGYLTKVQSSLLELFSKEINNSKRVEECFILQQLILFGELSLDEFKNSIQNSYGYIPTQLTIESCIRNLNFEFIRKIEKNVKIHNNSFLLHHEFRNEFDNPVFKDFLLDSINYSIAAFDKTFIKENYIDGLVLYNKYSRKDVCRLLNWDKDISSTLYGYRTKDQITPCFVTYHKSDEIDSTINYNDYFINPSTFAWESRSNRKIDSDEIMNVVNSRRILLFVKKGDGEGTDFYFMGDVSIIPNSIEQSYMPNSNLPVVHFKFQLKNPVIESLYNYITKNKSLI